MKAMILAAGRGERMRPLSDDIPKPLMKVGGKPLIAWQIERLAQAGFEEIIINICHLGEKIEEYLTYMNINAQLNIPILYSKEQEALETFGGIANALSLLGNNPFIVVSADIYTHFNYASLSNIDQFLLESEEMAYLVLTDNPPFNPNGDMGLSNGRITLSDPKLTYANIGVFHPDLFKDWKPNTKQALSTVLYPLIEKQKISGTYYSGTWFNIGTPEALKSLDQCLKSTF